MTFLNQALAFGAAALLIPLVIHILNRSRFRTVQWGAMHLLEAVINVNHKRFQLEQWILLIVRCAIPVLLALALARPVLTGSRMLEGDAPVSIVILLDTSYSMDTVNESGSRFRKAVDAACDLIDATGRGSDIYIIETGGSPAGLFDQPSTDADSVTRRLKLLRGGFGASQMQMALDQALATLSAMSNVRRELVVISDFQPADWDNVGLNAESIRQQCDAMDIHPTLTLLPVGDSIRRNVSVNSLTFPSRALGVGQQLMVRANLHNHGDSPLDNTRVIMRIDGAEFSVSQVSLAANGTTQVLFPCSFDSAGSHVMEVEVVADDSLLADNRYAAAVTVWNRVDVLLVDGAPSSQPLQGETDYLSVALTPFAFGRVKLSDLIETKVVAPNAIDEPMLRKTRVVVLANVPRLDDNRVDLLTRFVRDGGALLVCAGNRIDLNWYNDKLFAQQTGLLPVAFGAPRGKIDDTGSSSRIVTGRFDYPALELFNEPANGDLSTAEIRQWYELRTGDHQADASGVLAAGQSDSFVGDAARLVVMARLDTGEPFMVERLFGEGVVVQLATACDADWSDLPMRPVYVPLMQQLITSMASRISPPRNIRTGEPAVALLDDADLKIDAKSAASRSTEEATRQEPVTISVVTPEGARRMLRTVPERSLQVARFTATRRPGIYTMSLPTAKNLHFVAETSRVESDPTLLNESELAELAENLNATVVKSSSDYLEQEDVRRHGREIWKYVLGALLVFMFLEVVLQQRFARVST